MAFVKINKSFHIGRPSTEPRIRMGSHLHGGAKEGPPRGIYIAMTQEIVKRVGWTLEPSTSGRQSKDGSYIERMVCMITVHEGVGEDSGFIQLAEDREKGYVLGSTKGSASSLAVNMGIGAFKHYVLNEVPVEPHEVDFTIDEEDHTILIQCPDWLRYNPQSYKAPVEVKKEMPRHPTKAPVIVRGDDGEVVELELNREQRRRIAKKIVNAMRA
jgi:hypothetical protein